jgi:hypothetical protein
MNWTRIAYRDQLFRCLFDIYSGGSVVPMTYLSLVTSHLPLEKRLAGDHTQVATPVPIPNTAVKHLGPMIV